MPDPCVSIILRSFNEAWALRETLPALKAQDYRHWELIVIDSGSTDGSVELIEQAQPRHFIRIKPEEYNPSRVMNLGMQLARSDLGIFLNADATPQGTGWLRPLVEGLQDPQVAAVFGRQIPRPDCQAVYAHDYERCFGPARESTRWEHFFSMASSGIRKDIWAKRGFLEKLQYSEDDEYTRWCREQGYRIVYVPGSVAMHSHNYTPQQAYKRSFGEAKALAAVWNGHAHEINWPRTVLCGWLNDARRDFGFCARNGRLNEWPHAARIRWQQRRAKLAGFREGWNFYRRPARAQTESPDHRTRQQPPELKARFTLDGDDALESHLAFVCVEALNGVRSLVGEQKLDALVLGGGYGRGQGGVLKTNAGDQPYNDLEFYVFLRGNRVWNEQRYRTALSDLGDRLSPAAGLHVEFKVDSLARLRRGAVTMFSYDLVSGHRVIGSRPNQDPHSTFTGCEHHLEAKNIPLNEATRLLFNRCTGLLLAKELLRARRLTPEQADFIARNLAKAQLALGDVVLTVAGQYHWSCLERRERLERLADTEFAIETLAGADHLQAVLKAVQEHHAAGVDFKLHPRRILKSAEEFRAEHRVISNAALHLWLWLESRRLNRPFPSVCEYAFSPVEKCRDTQRWRNVLLNAKNFRLGVLSDGMASRYPRERLLNSLPLLLWEEPMNDLKVKRHLQNQLRTPASDWQSFVTAYKALWPSFS